MKRKILFLLSALTISATLLSGCKASDSVDNSAVKSEATETAAVESEATETVAETETGTESTVAENTEATENTVTESTEATEEVETTEIIESTDIAKGEPLSEKDLAFSFLGYDTYNDYVEAGNDGAVYILADNANMIVSGEFTDDGDVLKNTVRGIKLGDSIDKVFELYGQADKYDTFNKNSFSHDNLKDVDQYLYFFKLESTKDYFYSFRFVIDQYGDVIGVIIEPIQIKYWTGNKTE